MTYKQAVLNQLLQQELYLKALESKDGQRLTIARERLVEATALVKEIAEEELATKVYDRIDLGVSKKIMIEKPKAKKVERLDYHDCQEYIEDKYGIDIDDYAERFGKESSFSRWCRLHNADNSQPTGEYWEKFHYGWKEAIKKGEWEDDVEFQSFWSFICDCCEIHNGCEFCLPGIESANKEWEKTILNYFLEEFGDGPYWVDW